MYRAAVVRTREQTPRLVGHLAGTLGGALLLGASFAPWTSRGAGSSIALVRIADLVLSGAIDTWVPRGAGLVVYAIPLGGALLLLGTGLGRTAGALVSATGVLLALLGAGLALLALDRLDRTGLGLGALAAGTGIILGLVALAAQTWERTVGRSRT